MYKMKPTMKAEMPEYDGELKVLVLNTSLKHKPNVSNTEEVAQMVLDNMGKEKVSSEMLRIADMNIPVGLGFRESPDDEWPKVVEKIKAADIVIFATPIWWGNR